MDFEGRQLCIQVPAQPLGHDFLIHNLSFLSLILHRLLETIILGELSGIKQRTDVEGT